MLLRHSIGDENAHWTIMPDNRIPAGRLWPIHTGAVQRCPWRRWQRLRKLRQESGKCGEKPNPTATEPEWVSCLMARCSGAAQAIVDRRAQTVIGYDRNSDASSICQSVHSVQTGKQVGGGLDQIAAR